VNKQEQELQVAAMDVTRRASELAAELAEARRDVAYWRSAAWRERGRANDALDVLQELTSRVARAGLERATPEIDQAWERASAELLENEYQPY